ncbi:TetR/AcrR family transcriptional regulator [Chelatococcus reniformis]|uniref:HTH tetR-type domain-containing protein n=1 Tax=Chelatococcus reniformis TaxID=1494448 RepID=A0A916XKL9_9HYPH|nr:TetR/AcrR family transcriptional regulator [Chelatococcus reniformis]GGC78849.1 hypothetical protein GCM10010994_41240 [Chelatococcus reniformis]
MVAGSLRNASEDRRRRIVAAAVHLFSVRLYQDVQMDDVAREAGVAKPTLYRYFAAKEDLFIEAMGERLDAVEGATRAQAAASAPAADTLRAAIATVLDAFGRDAAALTVADGTDNRIGERARSVVRRKVRSLRSCFAQIIRAGIDDGQFAAIDPEVAADAVLGAIRLLAVTSEPARRGEAAAIVAHIFTAGLAHAPAAQRAPATAHAPAAA